jgi:lipid-binding SYLF domain-containing protein
VTIGGNISATAGPVGTGGSVQASLAHPAPMFSYSKSKGVSGFLSALWIIRLDMGCQVFLRVCR